MENFLPINNSKKNIKIIRIFDEDEKSLEELLEKIFDGIIK